VLNLEEVIEKMKDRKLRVVSEQTGLSYATVWRVATGRIKDVSYETIKKISDYLEEK
jgi:DNA-binding Xre family transcriptional regulator